MKCKDCTEVICPYRTTSGETECYYSRFVQESAKPFQCVQFAEEITWNSIRTQAAIAAMQGILSNSNMEDGHGDYKIDVIKTSIIYADALIAELKKGE